MAWLEIDNGDNGSFENAPSNWDIGTKEDGLFNYLSDLDESFKGSKSLYSGYSVNIIGGIAPPSLFKLVKELRFSAVANKFYRIRAYIRFIAPNVVNQSDKENLILRLKANSVLGASPQNDSFPNGVSLANPSLDDMISGQWHKIEVQYKAFSNGNIFFDLEHFYDSTGFNPNILEGAFFNFDAVEYFEHDKLVLTASRTLETFKGASDGKITADFNGGSGDFKIEFFKKLDPENIFYTQFFQTSTDPSNPISTFEIDQLDAGFYRVIITDNELSYSPFEDIEIQEVASNLTLVVNKQNISAAGLSDGSINLSATGDSGDYTFLIKTTEGTFVSDAERTDLPAGLYRCSVNDNINGETDGELVVINDPASNLTLSLTKQDVTIPGLSNGQITANAFGDTGVYAFSIAPAVGQQDNNVFTGLAAGVYDITVEDLNSQATVTEQITIIEPGELSINITSQTNNLCFESENGVVNISVDGGTGPYTYLWNDGATTLNRTGLSTGNHQLRVTDILGYSKVFTITITSPARIIINISKTGQEVTVNVSGGVAPYTYLWSDGSVETQRTLAIGSYIVQVTDANGCSKSAIVEITEFKFYFSKNPVWLERVTDPAAKPNLSWDAAVNIEKDYNTGNFESIFTANHPALEDGSTVFDFAEILKGQLKLELPEHKGKTPYVMEGNFKRFFVETNEKYGEPPVAQTAVTTETFHILRGGLSREEFADGSFFSVFLDNPKTPFFSWEAVAKNVYPDQPEYLAYPLVNIGSSQIKVKAEAFNRDNQILFTKETDFVNAVQPYMLINFPVGFSQLGFSSIVAADNISYYTVEVLNQNNIAVSEKKYFYMNINTQNSRKYFIYENALGAWATIVADGSRSGSLEVEMEMVKSPVQFDYGASDRTEKSENKILMQSFNQSAGNLIEDESFVLADFIASHNVYEFTDKRWRPVRIEMNGDWFNNYEDTTPFEFSVMYEKDKNWTPDIFRRDNRKIITQEVVEEPTGIFSTIANDAYSFETQYSAWKMPEMLRDISRSTLESRSGSASAKFLTSNYQNYRGEGEINEIYAGIPSLFFFGIKNLLQEGKRNKFKIYIKSDGIDFSSTSDATFKFLQPDIRVKLFGDEKYTPQAEGKGTLAVGFYRLDQSDVNFTNGWVEIGVYIDILNFNDIRIKNSNDSFQLEDAIFDIKYTGSNSTANFLNNVEIFFDDFSVTYENL